MSETAYERIIRALREHGSKVITGHGGQKSEAQCPNHDDHNASLSVTGITGRTLVWCHNPECDTRDVLAALDLTLADLYDERSATYRYDDGLVAHRRYRDGKKTFWQENAGKRTVLYRLDQLRGIEPGSGAVFLVEGEADVHAIEAAGGVATTAPAGAGSFHKVDASPLAGHVVTVVVDRDAAGDAWAAQVTAKLDDVGATYRFFHAKEGKDASDHIAAGHGLTDFVQYQPPIALEATDDECTVAQQEEIRPSLTFSTVAELRARVRAAGPRRWLLRGLWPAGDYGVHAGEMKAQKSWNTVAVAVAVASGTPWLGAIDVDLSGPVVMFAGEGGEADLLRRIDAVAAAAGVDADDLPITICARAPHLRNIVHLGEMADQLDRERPVLVTLDPLYLSAGGAKGSDLYAMGELLERPQHLCQQAGSGLWVTTHTNRKEGRGASRITGAGPAEWGRVLATATVKSRKVDKVTRETTVITELDFIGGSIPGGTLRVTRRIHADDPDDLDSLLHCWVKAEFVDEDEADTERPKMPPSRAKLLEALRHFSGAPVTVRALVDHISAKHGHGLTRETCSRELNALLTDGYADRIDQGKGAAAEWFVTADGQAVDL